MNSASRPGSSKRPRSIAELVAAAHEFPWDPSKPLKDILMTASALRSCGDKDRASGDLEGAFINYARAATIARERIPQHPAYSDLSNDLRYNILMNGMDIQDYLDELKPLLVKNYEMHSTNTTVADNSVAAVSNNANVLMWPATNYADSEFARSQKLLAPPAVPSSAEGRSPIYNMKKLFQRQKGGRKSVDLLPVPFQLPPLSTATGDSTPAEEHWVTLRPSNGAIPATQHSPSASDALHGNYSEKDEEGPTGPPDAPGELMRMIGYLTGFAADDWTVMLEVCERTVASEANAREVAKALRREFKYAQPSAQLVAARIWAVLLKDSSDFFIAQTTTKKFLDVVEEVCTSSTTAPVVRERLLEVIAGAAFARSTPKNGFTRLWQRVKGPGQPDAGIPLDDMHPMFTPPTPKAQRQSHPPYDHAPQMALNLRLPLAEDESRNLYSQCEFARNNARVLSEALGFVKPGELASNPVIKEFHANCMRSQEFIVAQIPWATANAERSRDTLQEEQAFAASIQGDDGREQRATETAEEQLLEVLLQANQDLVEVFMQYDDLDSRPTPLTPRAQRLPDVQHPPTYASNPSPQLDTARQRTNALFPGAGVTTAQQRVAHVGRRTPQNLQEYGNHQGANGGGREREMWVPSVEDELRKLHSQCELARNNARVLSEALGFAKPNELASKLVIKEFRTKCVVSQEFIIAQIPWATAKADRSREKLQKEQVIAVSIQDEEGQQRQPPETAEEQLLAELLQTNQDLVDVSEQYDELLKQLHAPDGGVGDDGSGSRSPSPSPLARLYSSGAPDTRMALQPSRQGGNVSSPTRRVVDSPPLVARVPASAALGPKRPPQRDAKGAQPPARKNSRRLRVTNLTASEKEQRIRRRGGPGGEQESAATVPQSDERATFRRTVEQLREQAKEKATLLRIRLAVGGMSQLELEAREQCVSLLAMIKAHHRRASDEDQSDQLKDEPSPRKRLTRILFEAELLINDVLKARSSQESESQPESSPEARNTQADAEEIRRQYGKTRGLARHMEEVLKVEAPQDIGQNQIVDGGLLPTASTTDTYHGTGGPSQALIRSTRSASEQDVHQESVPRSRTTSSPRGDGRQLALRMSEIPRLEEECTRARASARKLEAALDQASLHDLHLDEQTRDLRAGCQTSRDWATDWIPWAKATVTLSREADSQPPLEVELLLAKLLLAREELTDVLGRYGDLFVEAHGDSANLWEHPVSSAGDVGDEEAKARDASVSRQRQQRLFRLAQAHRPVSATLSDGSSTSTTTAMGARPLSMATFESGSDTEYDPINPYHVAAKAGMERLDDDVRTLNTFNSRML